MKNQEQIAQACFLASQALALMADGLGYDTKPEKTTTTEPKPEKVTLEDLRAVLAAKSQQGKRSEVKALFTKFGSEKLSEIKESDYQALKNLAEEL